MSILVIIMHHFLKYRVETQTDTQTNGGKNRTPRLPSAWTIRARQLLGLPMWLNSRP